MAARFRRRGEEAYVARSTFTDFLVLLAVFQVFALQTSWRFLFNQGFNKFKNFP